MNFSVVKWYYEIDLWQAIGGKDMIELMKKAIEVLKIKVNSNLDEIKKNEILFHKMLSDGIAAKDSNEMNRIILHNKSLLNENFDYINVQISLLKFLEKYQYQKVFTEPQQSEMNSFLEENKEDIDVFNDTISGRLKFAPGHPLFNDDIFFTRLMVYYENIEEYEKCAELIKLKRG